MHEPKIDKLKDGYSSNAGLIFLSWLKDIHLYVEDHWLRERETIQLIKDFTTEHARVEMEYYMAVAAEENQSSEGLMHHLSSAIQSDMMIHKLIGDL